MKYIKLFEAKLEFKIGDHVLIGDKNRYYWDKKYKKNFIHSGNFGLIIDYATLTEWSRNDRDELVSKNIDGYKIQFYNGETSDYTPDNVIRLLNKKETDEYELFLAAKKYNV